MDMHARDAVHKQYEPEVDKWKEPRVDMIGGRASGRVRAGTEAQRQEARPVVPRIGGDGSARERNHGGGKKEVGDLLDLVIAKKTAIPEWE